jgi:Zinc finger, C3HC4 type (RING finger)
MTQVYMIQENFCIICFEMYHDNKITFVCDHSICFVCYEKLLQLHIIVHCPICRLIIDMNDKIVFPNEVEQERNHSRNVTNCICCSIVLFLGTFYFVLLISTK